MAAISQPLRGDLPMADVTDRTLASAFSRHWSRNTTPSPMARPWPGSTRSGRSAIARSSEAELIRVGVGPRAVLEIGGGSGQRKVRADQLAVAPVPQRDLISAVPGNRDHLPRTRQRVDLIPGGQAQVGLGHRIYAVVPGKVIDEPVERWSRNTPP